MIVNELNLYNFRSYQQRSFSFKKGLNIIIGDNAVGKTNIVEAINYLSIAKSYRGVSDEELIYNGKDNGRIDCNISIGKMIKRVSVIFVNNQRRILINGKPIRKLSELVKEVNVILFEPSDTQLFIGPPKQRRDFLDVMLSKIDDNYLEQMITYEKLLKDRNEILKCEEIDQTLLQTTTEMLVSASKPIVESRSKFVKDINDILIKIARALICTHEKIEVIYTPYTEVNSEFNNNALELMNKALEGDLKHKATSIGVHREDFKVLLDGKDIALYGSQAENRLVALSLKLAPYFLVTDKDKKPILILDDVMSELDENHKECLIRFLKKMEQTFITATKLIVSGTSHYEIKKEN